MCLLITECAVLWGGTMVGNPVILYQLSVFWSLGGHRRFIHYLQSCSSSAWDLKKNNTFLYWRKREWELTEVYFNELGVCLTSFFALPDSVPASHDSEWKRESDSLTWRSLITVVTISCNSLLRTTTSAQEECFKWKLEQRGSFACKGRVGNTFEKEIKHDAASGISSLVCMSNCSADHIQRFWPGQQRRKRMFGEVSDMTLLCNQT